MLNYTLFSQDFIFINKPGNIPLGTEENISHTQWDFGYLGNCIRLKYDGAYIFGFSRVKRDKIMRRKKVSNFKWNSYFEFALRRCP